MCESCSQFDLLPLVCYLTLNEAPERRERERGSDRRVGRCCNGHLPPRAAGLPPVSRACFRANQIDLRTHREHILLSLGGRDSVSRRTDSRARGGASENSSPSAVAPTPSIRSLSLSLQTGFPHNPTVTFHANPSHNLTRSPNHFALLN